MLVREVELQGRGPQLWALEQVPEMVPGLA